QNPDQPNFRLDLGSLLNTHATLLAARRQSTEAIKTFREALSVFAPLTTVSGTTEIELESAKTKVNLGAVLVSANQLSAGLEMLRAAVADFRRLAESEDDPQYARELGRATANLGTAHVRARQFDEALNVFRQANEFLAQLTKKFPRVPDYRFELAKTHDNIAEVLQLT